jgi:hypothetical protein
MAEKLPSVKSVKPGEGRTVEITFADGERRAVDLSGFIVRYRALAPLADPAVFARAKVADWGGAVSWGGDAALSATTLRRAGDAQRRFSAEDFAAWMKRVRVSNQEAADMLGVSLSYVKKLKAGTAEVPTSIAVACRAIEEEPTLLATHYRPRTAGRPRKVAGSRNEPSGRRRSEIRGKSTPATRMRGHQAELAKARRKH